MQERRNKQLAWSGNSQYNERYWQFEPNVGRVVARLSARMDRNINDLFFILHLCIFTYVKLCVNGKTTKENGIEILQTLRRGISEGEIQWQIRGFEGISEKEILLAHLCELQENEFEQKWLSLESQKISKEELRKLWTEEESSCSSHRPKSQKQQVRKPANTLHTLSQILARYAREARITHSRENAIYKYWDTEPSTPRVATGIKNRIDRLKGLGNAIVPQVAYEIFKAIVNYENTHSTN